MFDNLDETNIETADLSLSCFCSSLFEDNFQRCLEFLTQNKSIGGVHHRAWEAGDTTGKGPGKGGSRTGNEGKGPGKGCQDQEGIGAGPGTGARDRAREAAGLGTDGIGDQMTRDEMTGDQTIAIL